jgi:putative molybdopterin biosynthesis protein
MSKNLMCTKEVAKFLEVNEKQVYSLIADKGLPGTKVTGKWLFPLRLVEQWIDSQTINYPKLPDPLGDYEGLLIIAGSNDILLDKAISLFNERYPDHLAVFGNLGSMGGLRAMRRNLCHVASSHLLQDNDEEYNFGFAREELTELPAVVNFCRREQGLIVAKGNPKMIQGVPDLQKTGMRIVNRPLGTGTRLLLDRELEKAGLAGDKIEGYGIEMHRHLDVGLEVLAERADAGPAISAVAASLDLDFIPLRWERFDLLISKNRFFDRGVQLFLGLVHDEQFLELASGLSGYDLSLCGKMVYPNDLESLKQAEQDGS